MSIKGLLLRFCLLYSSLLLLAGWVVSHFGMKQITGLNIGILSVCVIWVCHAFGKKNGRYFSESEKTAVILGLVAINISLQLLIAVTAPQSRTIISPGILVVAAAVVGSLHAIVIFFCVNYTKKLLIK